MLGWFRRLRDPGPPTVVVVEPSPFRQRDTYPLGPMPRRHAMRAARRACRLHPFSEVLVVNAKHKVARGDTLIWAGQNPAPHAKELRHAT